MKIDQAARSREDYEQAWKFYEESLILNKGADKWDTAYCLVGLGGLAGVRNEFQQAARLLGAAAALFENHRDLYAADRIIFDRDVATVQSQLGEEAFAAAWAEGKAMPLEKAVSMALEQTYKGIRRTCIVLGRGSRPSCEHYMTR